MKCSVCHSENEADSKFCFNCGSPLTVVSTSDSGISKEPPKNKNHKFIIAIAAITAILAIVGILTYLFFPKIQRSVMGETQYYFYKESKNIENAVDLDFLKELRHPDTYTASSKMSVDCDSDDQREYADFISELTADIKLSHDKDEKKVSFDGSVNLSDTNLASLGVNYDNNKILVRNGKESIVADFSVLYDLYNNLNDSSSDKSKSTSKNNNVDLLNLVNNVCESTINEDFISETGKEEFEGTSYDYVQYEFTDKQLVKLAINLLKTACKDENFTSFVATLIKSPEFISILYEMDIISDESISDIPALMSELYDFIKGLDDNSYTFYYKVYYDWRGNIPVRIFSDNFNNSEDCDNYIVIRTETKGDDFNLCIGINDYGDGLNAINIKYFKTVKDNKVDCDFEYSYKIDKGTTDEFGEPISNIRDVKHSVKLEDFGITKLNGINILTGDFSYTSTYASDEWITVNCSAFANDTYEIEFDMTMYDDYEAETNPLNVDVTLSTDLTNKADVNDVNISGKESTDYESFFENFVDGFVDNYSEKYSEYEAGYYDY